MEKKFVVSVRLYLGLSPPRHCDLVKTYQSRCYVETSGESGVYRRFRRQYRRQYRRRRRRSRRQCCRHHPQYRCRFRRQYRRRFCSQYRRRLRQYHRRLRQYHRRFRRQCCRHNRRQYRRFRRGFLRQYLRRFRHHSSTGLTGNRDDDGGQLELTCLFLSQLQWKWWLRLADVRFVQFRFNFIW